MQILPSSFKDPSGFVFQFEKEIYRAINKKYLLHYDLLIKSGLYDHLTKKRLLISHQEVESIPYPNEVVKIVKPIQIPLISYAYEWSFGMLQDAAICTLENAIEALSYGMILKDANTFNIQFFDGQPILIDTLSFEKYNEAENWIAYKQFCECFLAPLVLMKYSNLSLNKLLIVYPNGIPLEVCISILPFKARFNLHVFLHIFLQNKFQKKNLNSDQSKTTFSKKKMLTLLSGLKSFVCSLKAKQTGTEWDNYYQETILSKEYLQEKKRVVANYLKQIDFKTLLDLGANDGEFSLLLENTEKQIISVDADSNCIEKLYRLVKKNNIKNIQGLVVDLSNPSPGIGWLNKERDTLLSRISADVTLVLALVHHLVMTYHISIEQIVSFLHSLSTYIIIEFVDKTDEKVVKLLENREDIFADYTLEEFKTVLLKKFDIMNEQQLNEKSRTLFLLKRK